MYAECRHSHCTNEQKQGRHAKAATQPAQQVGHIPQYACTPAVKNAYVQHSILLSLPVCFPLLAAACVVGRTTRLYCSVTHLLRRHVACVATPCCMQVAPAPRTVNRPQSGQYERCPRHNHNKPLKKHSMHLVRSTCRTQRISQTQWPPHTPYVWVLIGCQAYGYSCKKYGY